MVARNSCSDMVIICAEVSSAAHGPWPVLVIRFAATVVAMPAVRVTTSDWLNASANSTGMGR